MTNKDMAGAATINQSKNLAVEYFAFRFHQAIWGLTKQVNRYPICASPSRDTIEAVSPKAE